MLVADVGSDAVLHGDGSLEAASGGGGWGQGATAGRGGDGGERVVAGPPSPRPPLPLRLRGGRGGDAPVSATGGVQETPNMVHDLLVCAGHIKVESIGSLTLDVPQERLAVAG